MTTQKNIIIILVVIILIVLVFLWFCTKPVWNNNKPVWLNNKHKRILPEHFNINEQAQQYPQSFDPKSSANANISQYQQPDNIDDLLIDEMACHPDCCGDSWPVSYDGLDANQVQQTFVSSMLDNGGPYVRTGYTCAGGKGGVGCPCVTRDAYINLANRGQGFNGINKIEPTLFVGNDLEQNVQICPSMSSQ